MALTTTPPQLASLISVIHPSLSSRLPVQIHFQPITTRQSLLRASFTFSRCSSDCEHATNAYLQYFLSTTDLASFSCCHARQSLVHFVILPLSFCFFSSSFYPFRSSVSCLHHSLLSLCLVCVALFFSVGVSAGMAIRQSGEGGAERKKELGREQTKGETEIHREPLSEKKEESVVTLRNGRTNEGIKPSSACMRSLRSRFLWRSPLPPPSFP